MTYITRPAALLLSLALFSSELPAQDEKPSTETALLVSQARTAFRAGESDKAVKLAEQAIAQEPKNPRLRLFAGSLHATLRQYQKALAQFDKAVELDPKSAQAYDLRGAEHFKLGNIKQSIADFDQAIELDPRRKPGHWQRGIAYYYAGQYDAGRKQFEGYQTVDDSDVENAVWRFLCMARASTPEKARGEILKIGEDRRVPMKQIYELFAGNAKPQEVLSAAKAGDPDKATLNRRLFYAYQYLGLYHEAQGNDDQALEYTRKAVDHKIGHYMWDVARVHLLLREKQSKKP